MFGIGEIVGGVTSGLAGGGGPNVAGPAISGYNTVITVNDKWKNIGQIVANLAGPRETGGIPAELPNGLPAGFSNINGGQNGSASVNVPGVGAIGLSVGPLVLFGVGGILLWSAMKR